MFLVKPFNTRSIGERASECVCVRYKTHSQNNRLEPRKCFFYFVWNGNEKRSIGLNCEINNIAKKKHERIRTKSAPLCGALAQTYIHVVSIIKLKFLRTRVKIDSKNRIIFT